MAFPTNVKIAHLSDLHVLALEDATPLRLMNKRFTGWVNLKLRRAKEHHASALHAVARAIRERDDLDHVVVTGDFTNLSLESEFRAARAFLDRELGLDPTRVSVIPGNHDAYTRRVHRDRRFERIFADYMTSDLSGAPLAPGDGLFPFVRLRGPVALIGLSSAVPRPPLMASGELGEPQRRALRSVLAHDEVRSRFPVLLIHHPLHPPPGATKARLNGLDDRAALREALNDVPHGLLLHGHLHRRIRHTHETARGRIDCIGATSASLLHDDVARSSGFNVYDIDASGLARAESFRLDVASGRFEPTPIPSA